jgi:hypothetical protein
MSEAPSPGADAALDAAISRLGRSLERLLPGVFPDLAGDLEAAAEFDPAPSVRQALTATAGLLRLQAGERTSAIVTAVGDEARRCLAQAGGAAADDSPGPDAADARDPRLVADIARAVRSIVGGDYPPFAQRVGSLLAMPLAGDERNPLGATTLAAAALVGLALPLGASVAVRARVEQAALRRMPAVLALALDDLGRWLAQTRFEPSPNPSSESLNGNAAGGRMTDASHLAADAAEVLGRSPLAAAQRAPLPALPSLQPVVELERDAVAFAHALGVPPYGRLARARFFGNARLRLREAGVAPAQLAVVDVVTVLFDYVVDEQRLAEAARPLLWRLQQPALALALLDPAYLVDEPRSLRRLVENLAAIAGAFPEDLAPGGELLRRLETVVRAVEVVAGALQSRASVIARQVEREYERATRSVTQLVERLDRERRSRPAGRASNRRDYHRRPSPEREQELTVRLSVMLGERLERHRVPATVREFLLTVWLRQLRTTALRDGEDSGEFKVAMQVVDDLLWSLDPESRKGARAELAARIPPLIRLLTQGVREVGVRDEDLKPFFDELFLVHLRRMQGSEPAAEVVRRGQARSAESAAVGEPARAAPGAPPASGIAAASSSSSPSSVSPPASRIIRERRAGRPPGTVTLPESRRRDAESLDTPDAVDAASPGDRLLQVLSSLDLADLPTRPSDRDDLGEDPMAVIERGIWLRMLLPDGADFYAKVAWVNERRTVVLMVRHPDRRALSMRMVELGDRFARRQAFVVAPP